MRANEFIIERWSKKYKSSINCSHPKGFSQRAHCAGKKKHTESVETEMVCESCGMCQTHGSLTEIAKGAKDSNGVTKCWPGKHAEGTKKGKNGGQVRNCVPNESQGVAEGDKPANPSKNYQRLGGNGAHVTWLVTFRDGTTKKVWADSREHVSQRLSPEDNIRGFKATKIDEQGVAEGLTPDEQFDIIEEMVEQLALEHGVDPEVIWEDFDSVDDNELLESAAWRRSAGKSKKGGLNAKGVASYRRENPGSKLQMAVTTKPSKLKAGSKAAKRRKSFCARMGGVKGPMKKPNGKPTRKALALRKWNC